MNYIETKLYTKQDIQNMLNKNNCLDVNKLRKTTLTTQLAYNIFHEITETPKCLGCQKDLRFTSFIRGYGPCGDRSCPLEKEKTKSKMQISLSQRQEIDVTCERCNKTSKTKQYNQKICPSCVKIIKKENILKNNPPASIEKLKEVINSFLDEERKPDSWNEVMQNKFPDVFVLAHNFKEENSGAINTLNQSIYHLFYDLDEVPKCKGCGMPVNFDGFNNGYKQFCPKTACQWVDKKDKQKRLDSIAKTVNNRRIDNNIGEYSYINFNYKNMKYANRKFGANKYFIPEFETLEEFDNNVEFLDFLDPLDFSNRYYCCVNNITQLKSCPTCSNPVHNVRLRYCSVQCASNSEIVRNKIEQTNIIKYGTKAPTQNLEVLERRTNNFIEKYGVPHHMNLESVIKKIKENNNEKYGSDWYLGSEFRTHMGYAIKEYTTPSGKIVKYQGYENFLLDELYSKYNDDDVINTPESIQYLDIFGFKHRYHPDCRTSEDILYEVKSPYTFEKGKENNVLYNKIKYSLEHCEQYVLVIYEKNGDIVDKRIFNKNKIDELDYLKVI